MANDKFVKVEVHTLFDKAIIYGRYIKKDEFGNHYVKVSHRFSIYKHVTKRDMGRLPSFLGSIFQVDRTIWHYGPEEDWKVKIGETFMITKNEEGTTISRSKKSEAEKMQKSADAAMKTGTITSIIGTKDVFGR